MTIILLGVFHAMYDSLKRALDLNRDTLGAFAKEVIYSPPLHPPYPTALLCMIPGLSLYLWEEYFF